MSYLDRHTLDSIDAAAFRSAEPFPWVNPAGFLAADAFLELANNMPELGGFTAFFAKERKHGQANHDRYVLDYRDGLAIPRVWQGLVDELRGRSYRRFIASLLGHTHFRLRFHWHYTPSACSVSPHCDSKTKLGSQIFYMNTWQNWDPAWGGETVILDDHGRLDADSSPGFDAFNRQFPAQTMDNRSLIFGRRGNSWHGVREINCPEGELRKVFIVVFEDYRALRMLGKRAQRLLKGKPLVAEKERGMY